MTKTTRVGRNDLVGNVAATTELTKENAKKVINAVLEGIFAVLKEAGKLQLTNFGSFTVKQTKERQGINPKTQAPITIPAGYRLGFKVCKAWKEGMALRKREQEKDKVRVHLPHAVAKANAAVKAVPSAKVAAKAKGKKK